MARKRESILVDDLQYCMVCGKPHPHLHEIFFGRNRNLSIKYKMVVPLCWEHHEGDEGPHRDREVDLSLKKWAQEKWELTFGERDEFIKVFGKSYL